MNINCTTTLKTVSFKAKHIQTHNPATWLLEMHTYVHEKTEFHVITNLLVLAKNHKLPNAHEEQSVQTKCGTLTQ